MRIIKQIYKIIIEMSINSNGVFGDHFGVGDTGVFILFN
jgi:hypothetical protein